MKFFIFLIGFIIYPFSFIVPRSRKKWAFGSFRNSFNDNAKYLFIHVAEQNPEIDLAWISADKKTVTQISDLGLKAYYIGSFKGFFHALRSKYWFFNSYTSDILFFASGNATCINLWHGVGLKKIEFCIETGKLAERYVKKTVKERFFHPEIYRKPDYFLSSTEFQSIKFAKAFRINLSQCLNLGYPRNQILNMPEDKRIDFMKKHEPESTIELVQKFKRFKKTYIYMPTWRDSQQDIFSENINLAVLNKILKGKDELLVLKPHANTKVDSALLSQYENILLLDNKTDIYTVLPYTHVLITDYSSILYDYILMKDKDVILYLYDIDEYINERDFNYPFAENVVGKSVYNFGELAECIKTNDYKIDELRKEEIRVKFWGEKQSISVCDDILKSVIQ